MPSSPSAAVDVGRADDVPAGDRWSALRVWHRARTAGGRVLGSTRARPTVARPAAAPVRRRPGGRSARGRAEARVAAGQGHHGRRLPRPAARHARPRSGHGVRGGRLPEHLRVLVRRDGHLHDQRRPAAPGPAGSARSTPATRCRSTPGSRPGGRGGGADGPGPRRHHLRGPRRPGRRRAPAASPRPSPPSGAAPPGPPSRCSSPTARATHASLGTIFDARPDVLNHNIETVARLQRAVRPSAGYARSLGGAGPGQGCRPDHQVGDHPGHGRARGRGAGHPGRPAGGGGRHRHHRPVPAAERHHLPVARWWTPEEFEAIREAAAWPWASPTSRRRR